MGWNGLPVQLGPIRFSMTIYPPLIICLWMVFWLGFEWAFLAAYLATWILVTVRGHAVKVGFDVCTGGPSGLGGIRSGIPHRADPVRSLHRPKSGVWFIVVSFVAAVAGSTGSFIWSEAHGLSAADDAGDLAGLVDRRPGPGTAVECSSAGNSVTQAGALEAAVLSSRRWWPNQPLRWIATAIAAGGLVLAGFLVASSELASARLSQALATDVSGDATARDSGCVLQLEAHRMGRHGPDLGWIAGGHLSWRTRGTARYFVKSGCGPPSFKKASSDSA